MATARQWTARGLMATAIAVPAIAIGMYALNPFGVQSYDPRQRILGYGIYRSPSASMAPTLEAGAIIFIRAGEDPDQPPARGDIVVFAPPAHPDQLWIKRVIGLPGETVGYHDNVVSIDGAPLPSVRVGAQQGSADDPSLMPMIELREHVGGSSYPVLESEAAGRIDPGEGDWIVPPGHYFLMGDNRDRSDDSRFSGPVPRSALRGRMIGRLQ